VSQLPSPRRRALLRATSAASLLLAGGCATGTARAQDPWRRAQDIIDRFSTPPVFRQEDFPITAFGAKAAQLISTKGMLSDELGGQRPAPAPGSPDARGPIAAAIAACHKAGGGRVLIPAGSWYCAGPIVLRSNVHVHLEAGAHIFFSANPADYARHGDYDCGASGKLVLSRWQGNDCLNYSPMVYGIGQDNIALTGADWTSILDGQGGMPFEGGSECWWDWKGRHRPGAASTENAPNPNNPASLASVAPQLDAGQLALIQGAGERWRGDARYLPALSEAGVAVAQRVFGQGHFLRPCMIELIGCSNVLLQGYQVQASPFWLHHPVNCRNLQIRQVRMDSLGPNSDGFDPEACDGVLVDGCTFNTGDDCIAIKAGKNRDTGYGPTRNIVIQHCVMNSGHGAVTLGSEMAGGIEHVYAQNLEFRNVHWASDPLNTAIRLKTNMNRGGFLRHFYVRNVSIPNGVQVMPKFYTPLPGSVIRPQSVASSAGGIITIDCDYAPADDNVRTRPPMVSDVHISGVKVGNVRTGGGQYSCYQAMVILGPVASSFNGKAGTPILPLRRITITDCDFGTPRNAAQPWFLHQVSDVTLTNVTIAGKLVSTTLSG
jgi:polygalacturonase